MFGISEKELAELFVDLKNKTNNFTSIEPELFLQNPRRILIIRMIFGMSLKQFANFVDTSFQAISNWELNKKIPAKWKILRILDKVLPAVKSKDIKIENILRNFAKFKMMSEGLFKNPDILKTLNENRTWTERQEYSINACKFQRRTAEEREISKILTDAKINFHEQYPIVNAGLSKGGYILSDFYVVSEKQKFIIETFHLASDKHKLGSIVQALKSYRIKHFFPKVKTICAIKTNNTDDKSVYILKEAFDFVAVNDFLSITNFIMKKAPRMGTSKSY